MAYIIIYLGSPSVSPCRLPIPDTCHAISERSRGLRAGRAVKALLKCIIFCTRTRAYFRCSTERPAQSCLTYIWDRMEDTQSRATGECCKVRCLVYLAAAKLWRGLLIASRARLDVAEHYGFTPLMMTAQPSDQRGCCAALAGRVRPEAHAPTVDGAARHWLRPLWRDQRCGRPLGQEMGRLLLGALLRRVCLSRCRLADAQSGWNAGARRRSGRLQRRCS